MTMIVAMVMVDGEDDGGDDNDDDDDDEHSYCNLGITQSDP